MPSAAPEIKLCSWGAIQHARCRKPKIGVVRIVRASRGFSLVAPIRQWAESVLQAERQRAAVTAGRQSLDSGSLRRLAQDVVSNTGLPGIALALIVGGRLISATAGMRNADRSLPLDESTHFEPNGLTKLLVASVAHELALSGKLELAAPFTTYMRGGRASKELQRISVADLLSHTSGYCGPNPANLDVLLDYSWVDFRRFLGSTSQLYAPGTVFNLMDTEAVIVGEVIRAVTGNDFSDLAREMFLNQLDVPRREVSEEPACGHAYASQEGHFRAVDAIRPCDFWLPSLLGPTMNIQQMANLTRHLLMGGSTGTASASLSAALTNQVVDLPITLHSAAWEDTPSSFGLGCGEFAPGHYGVSSTGMGQCNAVRVLPAEGIALAVALNASAPNVRDAVIGGVLATLTGTGRPGRRTRIELPCPASHLEGTYHVAESSAMQVSVDGARVIMRRTYDPWIPSEHAVGSPCFLNVPEPSALAVTDEYEGPAVGVFPDPSSGKPCLMVGLSAFKKAD